jgi:hypothetical protein
LDTFSITYPGSNFPYVILRDLSNNEVYDPGTPGFITYVEADRDDYRIDLTDQEGGLYSADVPDLEDGSYQATYFERTGGSAVDGDLVLYTESFDEPEMSGVDVEELTNMVASLRRNG